MVSEAEPASLSPLRTRFTSGALVLNAILHGTASVGMALGIGPHTADQPNMAWRAAAAGLAGAFMLGFVATRLRRDPALIVMPLVFVACNLIATLHEFLASGEQASLPPAIFETSFLLVYAFFASRLISSSRSRSRPNQPAAG